MEPLTQAWLVMTILAAGLCGLGAYAGVAEIIRRGM